MTTLPSFVELMASLGLDNPVVPTSFASHKTGPACSGMPIRHSRSSSSSSTGSFSSSLSGTAPSLYPSISVDSPAASSMRDATPADRDVDLDRRHARTARYSPYCPTISHMRKRSVPILKQEAEERPLRALSTSPYLSPASAVVGTSRRPPKLSLSQTDLATTMPISTFVRRKTPQTSPISPSFPHRGRKRSSSPAQPVSIPTMPLIFPPSPTARFSSPDTEDEDMQDASEESAPGYKWQSNESPSPRGNGGVRISVFSHPNDLSSSFARSVAALPMA